MRPKRFFVVKKETVFYAFFKPFILRRNSRIGTDETIIDMDVGSSKNVSFCRELFALQLYVVQIEFYCRFVNDAKLEF